MYLNYISVNKSVHWRYNCIISTMWNENINMIINKYYKLKTKIVIFMRMLTRSLRSDSNGKGFCDVILTRN